MVKTVNTRFGKASDEIIDNVYPERNSINYIKRVKRNWKNLRQACN